mgnify:CR=1 FL=1
MTAETDRSLNVRARIISVSAGLVLDTTSIYEMAHTSAESIGRSAAGIVLIVGLAATIFPIAAEIQDRIQARAE